MLAVGTEMFLLIPGAANERILHAGTVLVSDSKSFQAEFKEVIAVSPNQEFNAFGEMNGKFYQQGATVSQINQTQPVAIITFLRTGEPVNAEQRQTYRVSVAAADVFAKVEKEPKCRVVDLSPDGFAAIASGKYSIGSTIQVTIDHQGKAVSFGARVQTCQTRPDGSFRYGLLAAAKGTPARTMLQQMSSAAQREQLRRLRGAA